MGFIYIASASDPQFWHTFNVCGGAAVLSRYPITKKDELIFKNSVYSDSESSLGVVYAEIEVDLQRISLGSTTTTKSKIHLFTTPL